MKRSKFIFSLSPFGNGLDCPLDILYKKHDFPIIIINNLNQINNTMLNYWYNKYKNKISLNNPITRYKLTNYYWISYIRNKTLNKLQKKLNK